MENFWRLRFAQAGLPDRWDFGSREEMEALWNATTYSASELLEQVDHGGAYPSAEYVATFDRGSGRYVLEGEDDAGGDRIEVGRPWSTQYVCST